MSQFTIIDNRSLPSAPSRAPRREVEAGDALRLLTDRQLHTTAFGTQGIDPNQVAAASDPSSSGLILTSNKGHHKIQRLRDANPDLPILLEPTAIRHHLATPEAPFRSDQDPDLLISPDLAGSLDLQRLNNNPIAMTPTGQIASGDAATLKAALKGANELDRSDTLLMLPLAAGWLSEEYRFRLLQQALERSRHPVAITIIHRTNGIASGKRLRRYRELIAGAGCPVVAYRVDLAGFDALANGALACAVGAHPSARRLNPVGADGFASDRTDLSPHVLVTDLLGYVRSTHLRQHYFANAPALRCACPVCGGAPIDRLYGRPDRLEGHMHNVHELNRLFEGFKNKDRPQRSAFWTAAVRAALDEHAVLGTHIGKQLRIPADLSIWRDPR